MRALSPDRCSEEVEDAAVAILRVLKPLSKKDRMEALALACGVFVRSDCLTERNPT